MNTLEPLTVKLYGSHSTTSVNPSFVAAPPHSKRHNVVKMFSNLMISLRVSKPNINYIVRLITYIVIQK